jgi:hypothetical protein
MTAGLVRGVPMWRSPAGEVLTEEEALRRLGTGDVGETMAGKKGV